MTLPASTLARSKKIVDEIGEFFGRIADVTNLFFLLRAEISVQPVKKDLAQSHDRIQWSPELVAHIGEKVTFEFRSMLQEVRFLVQFSVKRHDAAVRLVQFVVQLRKFILLDAQLLQGF